MPVVKTQKANLDDVLKWCVHEAYCIELVTLSNSDVAQVAGDTILGHLAWYTGSVWKVLDSGDTISGTSLICPILYTRAMTGAVAADAVGFLKNVPILRRGPALVHKDGIRYNPSVVSATCVTAMLALGIKQVDEVGVVYSV